MRVLPPEATPDAAILLTTRGVRAFVDGLVSVVLPSYLVLLGFNGVQIGTIVTGTLLGSALLTLIVGFRGNHVPRPTLLRLVAVLMITTGLGFAAFTWFWALLLVAVVGTINPSSGDVSVFLPAEQAVVPETVPDRSRTAMFARYSLVAFVVAAFGSLAAGLPGWVAAHSALTRLAATRGVFLVYALAGVTVLFFYQHLSPRLSHRPADRRASALGASKPLVYRLAAVFCIDAFGGGFVVTSLISYWLLRRFHLSVATAGTIFFWAGLFSGLSALLAERLAARIGLVRTMVFTHLPANVLLMATAFMPTAPLAVACLLARSLLSQMDVPARTSYVMAIVKPEERPAAASVTNVPRSLASALPPLLAGWMLDHTTFGWPLLVGGALKFTYDLVLLVLFKEVRPPEEHRDQGRIPRRWRPSRRTNTYVS
jgi:MFS family permease